MFPYSFMLERRVRADGDEDLDTSKLFLLRCEDRKAEGYAEDKLKIYINMLKDMKIGVHVADKPLALSYLAILGVKLYAQIVAVDKTVIVIRLSFGAGMLSSYLIYDAVALSLRMIPTPKDRSWFCTLISCASLVRPTRGPGYALVHTGRPFAGGESSLFVWRPSSSSPPWSEKKKISLLDFVSWNETNTQFSFRGHAYLVDLLCGLMCFSCNALFDAPCDDNSSSVLKFIHLPLPVEPRDFDHRIAGPAAYRTMGIVSDSIGFVSIDGFQDYVKLNKRTVTVWRLLGHDKKWEKEYELSLQTLWRFEGFGDLPKHLTPMYPLDIVYLGLGEYRETKIVRGSLPPLMEFFPYNPSYMLEIDMKNKIVLNSLPLKPEDCFPRLVSCSFSPYLRKALLGPCTDEGGPFHKQKNKKKGSLEKPICC